MRKKILYCGLVAAFLSGCNQEVRQPVVRYESVPEIDKSVNVTGAAGELKRLTYGGPEELVSSVSKDGNWILMDTYSIENGVKSKIIIQKLNTVTSQKMILSPMNSSNERAVWSQNDSKFIFTTDKAGVIIAESMGVNGENGVRFITTSALGKAYSPHYNEVNKEITFVLNGSIAIVNLDGYQIRMYGEGELPKFSHDGKKVLFIRSDGNYRHIFIMNQDGTSLIQLTTETSNDYEAVWSPDDKKIVFISDRANKHNHLFVIDVDGRNLTQLTDGNYNVSSLDWGADGYIYFSANAGNNRDVWRLKLNK